MDSPYSQTYCALDLETTGVNPYRDKIIEIGIVKFALHSNRQETYHTLVNPEKPVSQASFDVHGIHDDELVDKPVYKNIAQEVISFIGDSWLVIQNPQFDLSFLQVEHRALGLPVIQNYSFDTVTLSRRAFPFLENHKLDTVAAHLGIRRTFHRALDDALSCQEIFCRALKKIDQSSSISLASLKELCGFDTKNRIFRKIQKNVLHGTTVKTGEIYTIRYVDREGRITERKIKPKCLYKTGAQTVIHAYCYLREEERFFSAKRIRRIRLVP